MKKLLLFLLLTSLSPLSAMNSFTARPLNATSNFTARNRTDGTVIIRERTTTLEYSFLLPYITLSPNEEKQVSFPSGSELRIETAGSLEVKKLGWHLKLLDITRNGSTLKVAQLATRPLIIKKRGDIRDLLITTVSPDRSAVEH